MKRKLNTPILGLFAALNEIASTATHKIIPWKFTARKVADRKRQTLANPTKKAHRKMIQASRRRNRI
jgi:hypothetical protein